MHAGANQLAQLVEIGITGIDDQIGAGDDRLQQAPFLLDRFPQRNIAQRQGMPTPGFAVALEQRLVVGLQKQHIHPQVAGAQFGQRGGKPVQFIDEIARVHPHRHGRRQQVAGGGDFPSQGQNQLERQVIDAVVVQVFQGLQRDGLAGAGQTADDDYSHGMALAMVFSMRAIRSCSARYPPNRRM